MKTDPIAAYPYPFCQDVLVKKNLANSPKPEAKTDMYSKTNDPVICQLRPPFDNSIESTLDICDNMPVYVMFVTASLATWCVIRKPSGYRTGNSTAR